MNRDIKYVIICILWVYVENVINIDWGKMILIKIYLS